MTMGSTTAREGCPLSDRRNGSARQRWRRTARAKSGQLAAAGLLLLACVLAPAAAESIFPGTPAPPGSGQVGPPAPDAAPAPRPHRSREEIDADIRNLEAERAELLAKYAEAHPDVRAVDRRLRILREEREMLGRAPAAAQ
jgi:hypothetical protein